MILCLMRSTFSTSCGTQACRSGQNARTQYDLWFAPKKAEFSWRHRITQAQKRVARYASMFSESSCLCNRMQRVSFLYFHVYMITFMDERLIILQVAMWRQDFREWKFSCCLLVLILLLNREVDWINHLFTIKLISSLLFLFVKKLIVSSAKVEIFIFT